MRSDSHYDKEVACRTSIDGFSTEPLTRSYVAIRETVKATFAGLSARLPHNCFHNINALGLNRYAVFGRWTIKTIA